MTLIPNACAHCHGALYYDPFEMEYACIACARRVPLRPRVLLDIPPSQYDAGTGAVSPRQRASRAVVA